jgi:DNA-binding response OmpR family regulator
VVCRRSADPRGGAHILLVEDSDTVRESLRRLLADDGYAVTVAVDGQHGLELAKSRRFDLISTDVVMPRLDGYELTRALRATPEYADTPILMVTSMGERIDRVRGFDAGVDEYITKPHDRALLLRAVRKLLGHGDPGPDPAGGGA